MSKKGMALPEILVASGILALAVSYIVSSMLALHRTLHTSQYHYVAMNLARDVLEYGEAILFSHQIKMLYYYPPATGNSIDLSPCPSGYATTTGYAIKEWGCWWQANISPFTFMGDIEAKGMVPVESPHSVVIYYEAFQEPTLYNLWAEHVRISWSEGGTTHTRDLATIPLYQNNQIHLQEATFTWQ